MLAFFPKVGVRLPANLEVYGGALLALAPALIMTYTRPTAAAKLALVGPPTTTSRLTLGFAGTLLGRSGACGSALRQASCCQAQRSQASRISPRRPAPHLLPTLRGRNERSPHAPLHQRFYRHRDARRPLLKRVENPVRGIQEAQPADTVVKMDFMKRPLPSATAQRHRDLYDGEAATKRRINASMTAPTAFERLTRRRIDQMDGWGVYAPITIPWTGLLDLQGIIDAHHGDDYAFENDLVYVIDVTKGSPTFGQPHPLDIGNGNFPAALEKINHYWRSDSRGDTIRAHFDEHDEDTNGNGKLDPGEDAGLDGVLDKPNYLPGLSRADTGDSLVKRADALMTFYERETTAHRARWCRCGSRPLRGGGDPTPEGQRGKPVGSPYRWVHHLGQTEPLEVRRRSSTTPATGDWPSKTWPSLGPSPPAR